MQFCVVPENWDAPKSTCRASELHCKQHDRLQKLRLSLSLWKVAWRSFHLTPGMDWVKSTHNAVLEKGASTEGGCWSLHPSTWLQSIPFWMKSGLWVNSPLKQIPGNQKWSDGIAVTVCWSIWLIQSGADVGECCIVEQELYVSMFYDLWSEENRVVGLQRRNLRDLRRTRNQGRINGKDSFESLSIVPAKSFHQQRCKSCSVSLHCCSVRCWSFFFTGTSSSPRGTCDSKCSAGTTFLQKSSDPFQSLIYHVFPFSEVCPAVCERKQISVSFALQSCVRNLLFQTPSIQVCRFHWACTSVDWLDLPLDQQTGILVSIFLAQFHHTDAGSVPPVCLLEWTVRTAASEPVVSTDCHQIGCQLHRTYGVSGMQKKVKVEKRTLSNVEKYCRWKSSGWRIFSFIRSVKFNRLNLPNNPHFFTNILHEMSFSFAVERGLWNMWM